MNVRHVEQKYIIFNRCVRVRDKGSSFRILNVYMDYNSEFRQTSDIFFCKIVEQDPWYSAPDATKSAETNVTIISCNLHLK